VPYTIGAAGLVSGRSQSLAISTRPPRHWLLVFGGTTAETISEPARLIERELGETVCCSLAVAAAGSAQTSSAGTMNSLFIESSLHSFVLASMKK